MRVKAVVHKAEKGGYWAEVPALPGCATQGETLDGLMVNLREAVEACLLIDLPATSRNDLAKLAELTDEEFR